MSQPLTIAMDVMGGDHGPRAAVSAAASVLAVDADVEIVLVGLPDVIAAARAANGRQSADRLHYREASEVVDMTDHPIDALRRKKNSSMRVVVDMVRSGEAAACVSAGNTGALMAISKFVLKTIPGVDRPAIMAPVPSASGSTFMLDLGANVGVDADNLVQFAGMGSVVAADVAGLPEPRIGLLNIGEEDIKGNETVREAGRLLGESTLNYIGFVEGNDIFSGRVDVVVTDGFSGNVSLKTMEGVASLIGGYLREEFTRGATRRLQAAVASPALRALRDRLDPRQYNGASFVGLSRVVVKSHGAADSVAMANAIRVAIKEVREDVPAHIGRMFENQKASCIPV